MSSTLSIIMAHILYIQTTNHLFLWRRRRPNKYLSNPQKLFYVPQLWALREVLNWPLNKSVENSAFRVYNVFILHYLCLRCCICMIQWGVSPCPPPVQLRSMVPAHGGHGYQSYFFRDITQSLPKLIVVVTLCGHDGKILIIPNIVIYDFECCSKKN